MESISQALTEDHRRCDRRFACIEEQVAHGNWAQADGEFSEFHRAMERHFGFEEQSLFPAFEQATGNRNGPTQMMRVEHEQMRSLVREMQDRLGDRDTQRYLGLSETLLVLMQQHNMKEEHMLYRMAETALGAEGPALAARFMQS